MNAGATCRLAILSVAATLLAVTGVLAQVAAGELTGIVQDASGVAVAGAAVTIADPDSSERRSTQTGAAGLYVFSALRPGLYDVSVELAGFKRAVHERVPLTTGERTRLDVMLEIGGVSETVTVSAEPSRIRTESATLGQVIPNRTIVGLPLNGRNFVQLASLSAGVALPPGSAFPRINGGRPRTNEYLFDGLSVLQPEPGQVAYVPVIDAIEEFKVETNSPPAEFGRFNGGVINLVTKAGTNDLRGAAFGFFRHESLNARNFFAPRTASTPDKPRFRRHQSGFVAGGPIVRDRTFFFADYQGTAQEIGRVRISTVPTRLQRQGIFTEPIGGRVPVIFDPAATVRQPGGGVQRTPFAGNAIPLDRLDPVAQALLARYPEPTSEGTTNNFRRVGNERQNQHQFDVRVDHHLGDSDRLFARLSRLIDRTTPVAPLPDGGGVISSGATGETDTGAVSLATSWSRVLGDRMTNELRVGYTRRSIERSGVVLDPLTAGELGLPDPAARARFGAAMPTFVIDGFQQLGSSASTFSDFTTDVTQVVDVLTVQKGSHLVKTGVDVRFERLNVVQPPSPTGSYRFSSLFTDLPGRSGTGLSMASFLLGQVQAFSVDLQERAIRPRALVQEYFVQDDWKVSPRFTVNAGLRYTLNFPSTEADDQGAVFNLETQRLDYLGRGTAPRAARQLHKHNFGPRLGLSYRLSDTMVVRSGYAMVWIEMAGITTPFTAPNYPFIQTVGERSLDNIAPAFVLGDGPTIAPVPITPDAGLGQGVFTVDRDLGSGYVQQWNVAWQRALPWGLSAELAYTGSTITHLGIPDTNINQLTVEQLQQGRALLEPVPSPFVGEIPASSSIGEPPSRVRSCFARFPASRPSASTGTT